MAATLSQAIDMFKSIDVENTGLISREELKTLMQEIGGDMWAGDNFGTMLETCGVEPGDKDVNYTMLLKQLLGDEEPKVEASPQEEAPASAAEVNKEEAKVPTEQDIADSAALVEMVCSRILGTMKTEAVVEAKSEEPTLVAKLEEVKPEEAKPKEANPEEPKSEEVKPEEPKPEEAKSEEANPEAANAQAVA